MDNFVLLNEQRIEMNFLLQNILSLEISKKKYKYAVRTIYEKVKAQKNPKSKWLTYTTENQSCRYTARK